MIRQRAGRPTKVRDVIVIPLERVSITAAAGDEGIRGYASLSLSGVAVVSPGKVSVFNGEGEPVPIESCLEGVEGLREALAGV